MSLVIDLIGQLNCHVTGCKTRKLKLIGAFRSVCCSGNDIFQHRLDPKIEKKTHDGKEFSSSELRAVE